MAHIENLNGLSRVLKSREIRKIYIVFGTKAYFCTRSVGSHSKTLIITDTTRLARPTNTGPTYPREGTRVAMRVDVKLKVTVRVRGAEPPPAAAPPDLHYHPSE